MRKACFLMVVFLLPLVLDAQSFYQRRRERSFVASFGSGTATYFGELSNDNDRFDTKLNLEFGLEYKLYPRFSPKVTFTYFQLNGDDREADDPSRVKRNLRFTSNNLEISALGIVQVYEDGQRYYQRPSFNIYATVGIGILWYAPRADVPETDYAGNPFPDAGSMTPLRKLQTELVSYKAFGFVIPVGIGIRYKINPWFNLVLEGTYRKTFTDYLDDVSTTHPGPSAFTDPLAQALSDRRPELNDIPPAQPGTKRGNPDAKDAYFLWNIKIEYYVPGLFGFKSGGVPQRNKGRYR